MNSLTEAFVENRRADGRIRVLRVVLPFYDFVSCRNGGRHSDESFTVLMFLGGGNSFHSESSVADPGIVNQGGRVRLPRM